MLENPASRTPYHLSSTKSIEKVTLKKLGGSVWHATWKEELRRVRRGVVTACTTKSGQGVYLEERGKIKENIYLVNSLLKNWREVKSMGENLKFLKTFKLVAKNLKFMGTVLLIF